MIKFRPHHFLCTLGFEGKGYSQSFVQNYAKIANRLRIEEGGDETLIEVTEFTDAICEPCPNRRGTLCETQEKISKLDDAHAFVLGIKAGEQITWGAAKRKIAAQFTPEAFDKACSSCSWKSLGVCQKALEALKKTAMILTVGLFSASVFAAPAKDLQKAVVAKNKKDCGSVVALTQSALSQALYADHALALRGLCYLEKKQPGQALLNFEQLQKNYPASPWFKDVQTLIGRAEILAGKYENGFQRLLQENELYWLDAKSLEKYVLGCAKKKTESCVAWVTRFANIYAKNTRESKIIGKHFSEIVDRAKPVFVNSKITTGYKQKDADDLAFDKAYSQILDSDWGDAESEFEDFLSEYPKSAHRFRAKFWQATAIQNKRSLEQAKPLFEQVAKESPLTLYGLLSHRVLHKDPIEPFSDAPLVFENSDPYQTAAEITRAKRVKELNGAKAYALSYKDLRDLRPREILSPGWLLKLTSLAHEAKAHLTAFAMITELIQRDDRVVYNKQVLDWVFPTSYLDLIKKNAVEQNIDPLLVLSQIKQESAFEAETHSAPGASGLMQLMPFTASEVESEIERTLLLDPNTNIRIGIKYLKKMIERYRGNIACALAAYNAGPTAVDRWIREGKAEKSFLEFVEQIPYRETRDYVGSIYRNYVWYKRRVENSNIEDFGFFWPSSVPADFKKQ